MTLRAPMVRTRTFARIVMVDGHAAEVLAELRRELGTWLGEHPRRDDAVGVGAELVSNGIRHGSRPGEQVTLVARRTGLELEIDVADSGRSHDRDAPCVSAPPFGHGLRIVAALCASVDIEDRGGWRVRVVLGARPPEIVEPEICEEDLLAAYPDDGELGGDGDAA
jgi:anti-sigma regulatory factor (Ser/Thr protein kinase)